MKEGGKERGEGKGGMWSEKKRKKNDRQDKRQTVMKQGMEERENKGDRL